MAMTSSGTKMVPESCSKPSAGLNLSILSFDCEGISHGARPPAAEEALRPQSTTNSLSSRATRAVKDASLHSIDLQSYSSSSSTCSYKSKLPMVLEESESLSHREGSTVWDMSSSSSRSSVTSSSTSSTLAFLRGGASAGGAQNQKKLQKLRKRRASEEASMVSLLLWPFKKVRDGYMSCIMGFDGTGDLSGLAQGSTFAVSTKYFAEAPISKTDARNYG